MLMETLAFTLVIGGQFLAAGVSHGAPGRTVFDYCSQAGRAVAARTIEATQS